MRALPIPLVPRWFRYCGVGIVAAVLFYFSVLSAPPASPRPSPFWDKQLHFLGYAGFTLALAYATAHLRDRLWMRIILVLAIAVGYGLLIESIQWFQPNRYFSLGDALANVLGAVLASGWFLLESRLRYQLL
ncbi:hypothetical protein EI982_08620 [Haloplanus rallus]|uniref:VanZ-like domain-containing protein n=1 Tax=Haloplanus rallus TaxID=1816183 RepID=A0A6B9F3J2_9EURY|nr:hypothetical protein EI982_08620 [Haloplanus rallus]